MGGGGELETSTTERVSLPWDFDTFEISETLQDSFDLDCVLTGTFSHRVSPSVDWTLSLASRACTGRVRATRRWKGGPSVW